MQSASVLDTTGHNARIFFDPKLADVYAKSERHLAEVTFLRRHREAYTGKRILDLGVGSGRTTAFLLPTATAYLGIDIAAPMLAAARAAFPSAAFELMDLREIGRLGEGQFDFVNGSWAILSAFTHAERLQILRDLHRLLSPNGVFYFSAHNRGWRCAGLPPLNRWSFRPRRILEGIDPRNWMNYLRLRHLRREEEDYAIFNDSGHHWQGLFYYIDRHAQARQLAANGFSLIDCIGENGRVLTDGDDVSRDGLLHYVCRRV